MRRLCFLQRHSFKNLFLHLLILLLTVVTDLLAIVWVKKVVFAGYLFTDTSSNFFFTYFLIGVLIPSALETIINALIAYAALRTRKNLCRSMHSRYFAGNTYARALIPPQPSPHALPSHPPSLPPQLLQVEHVIRRHG